MKFELMIKLVVALRIIIPLVIKIAPSIKKIASKAKNGDVSAQNADIKAETEASPITAMRGRDAFAVQETHYAARGIMRFCV